MYVQHARLPFIIADALVIFSLHMFEQSLKKQKAMLTKLEEEEVATKNKGKKKNITPTKGAIKKSLVKGPDQSVFGNPFHTIQLPDKKNS